MMMRYLLMGLLMAAFLPGFPSTARGQLSIQTEVDRDRITIGDRITYTVTITRDPELEIVTPGLAANLGQFEIKDNTYFSLKRLYLFGSRNPPLLVSTKCPPATISLGKPSAKRV